MTSHKKNGLNRIGLLALACLALPSAASAEAGFYSFELKNTCVDDNVTISVMDQSMKETEVAKLSTAQKTYKNLDKYIPAKDENVTVRIKQYNIAGPWCSNFTFKRTDASGSAMYLQDDGRLGPTKTEIKRSGGMLIGVQSDFQILVNRATGAVMIKSR